MKRTQAQVDEFAKEHGIDPTLLVSLPTLGVEFNHINDVFQKHITELIENKEHEVISIKTSDVRFTCTHDDDKDLAIGNNAGYFEYSSSISDYRGQPVIAKADFIWTFRFKTINFFKKACLSNLHMEMRAALKKKLVARLYHLPSEERKEIIDTITQRVKNGTAFKVSSIVTRDKSTGTMLHWNRKQAGGVFVMALYAFKELSCRGYTLATDQNQHLWENLTGELWRDDCISISTPREGLTCALLALKKY
jgi:hypothetical protein